MTLRLTQKVVNFRDHQLRHNFLRHFAIEKKSTETLLCSVPGIKEILQQGKASPLQTPSSLLDECVDRQDLCISDDYIHYAGYSRDVKDFQLLTRSNGVIKAHFEKIQGKRLSPVGEVKLFGKPVSDDCDDTKFSLKGNSFAVAKEPGYSSPMTMVCTHHNICSGLDENGMPTEDESSMIYGRTGIDVISKQNEEMTAKVAYINPNTDLAYLHLDDCDVSRNNSMYALRPEILDWAKEAEENGADGVSSNDTASLVMAQDFDDVGNTYVMCGVYHPHQCTDMLDTFVTSEVWQSGFNFSAMSNEHIAQGLMWSEDHRLRSLKLPTSAFNILDSKPLDGGGVTALTYIHASPGFSGAVVSKKPKTAVGPHAAGIPHKLPNGMIMYVGNKVVLIEANIVDFI